MTQSLFVAARSAINQIAFHCRLADTATGVTRDTVKKLAERLGVDETRTIHLALHDRAIRRVPQYQADDRPLSALQMPQIKKRVSNANTQGRKKSVRSSLFEVEPA